MDDTKKWFQSRSVWASIIAVVAIAANALGQTISPEDQTGLIDGIFGIVAAGSSLAAIWGRLVAKKSLTS